MESLGSGLSRWFYLGIIAVIIGAVLIFRAKENKSKLMENGYFILLLGFIGIISEWTDFATVLFLLALFSGILLIVDKIYLQGKRKVDTKRPHYIHYAYEFFPVILGVFILRAFLFEAYQIPSSSMRPDLTVGDFILVSKFNYGVREPITNRVLIPVHKIQRGDVVVFKDQIVHNRDLIKRVVAIAGDKVEYTNKRLTINGQPLVYTENGSYDYSDERQMPFHDQRYIENLSGVAHSIITWSQVPTLFAAQVLDFKDKNNCTYNGDDGFSCTVPQGSYFMMGDNRDDSLDSRYWGFVPENAILGKTIYVWMNLHDFSRIGTKI